MNKLRTELNDLLIPYFPDVIVNGESVSKVHYQTAPSTSPFPYVVFNLPNSFTNEEQEIFSLDVDIWDNNKDTTELEALASTLWKELHKHHHIDESIQFSIHRENRIPELDETNIGIRRRKLIFQLRYLDRTL